MVALKQIWGPWVSVPGFIAIHPVVVDVLESGRTERHAASMAIHIKRDLVFHMWRLNAEYQKHK